MSKRDKIIYWVATLWLCLGMASTGVVQIVRLEDEVNKTVNGLGYPVYFLIILGTWKMLGVVAMLIPKTPLLKEWAYAGFIFAMTGAIFSHIASGSAGAEFFGPGLLIVLTIVSWYFRPADRKVVSVN